jgi:hypothetical protein
MCANPVDCEELAVTASDSDLFSLDDKATDLAFWNIAGTGYWNIL